MKNLKKLFSLFLCCVLLAAFAPLAHAKDVVVLDEVSAYYTVPAAGEAFDFDTVTVPDGAHYTAEIVNVYYNSFEGDELTSGGIVEAGVTYYVCIRFTPESGYAIEIGKTVFYVNDRPTDVLENIQMPVDTFTVKGGSSDWDHVLFGRFDLAQMLSPFFDRFPGLFVLSIILTPLYALIDAFEWVKTLVMSLVEYIIRPAPPFPW